MAPPADRQNRQRRGPAGASGSGAGFARSARMEQSNARDLDDLLGELEEAARTKGRKVSVEEIHELLGERSFGPLLLLAGLLGMTPVSAAPTAPSILALIVILVAGQLLIGRERLWLPRRLLHLSVDAEKLRKSVALARRPARILDRIVRPRLCFMTGRAGQRASALACVLVAATTPPLELLPFVAIVPAAAIAAFGLGLVTRDGAVLAGAFAASVAALAAAARQLLQLLD